MKAGLLSGGFFIMSIFFNEKPSPLQALLQTKTQSIPSSQIEGSPGIQETPETEINKFIEENTSIESPLKGLLTNLIVFYELQTDKIDKGISQDRFNKILIFFTSQKNKAPSCLQIDALNNAFSTFESIASDKNFILPENGKSLGSLLNSIKYDNEKAEEIKYTTKGNISTILNDILNKENNVKTHGKKTVEEKMTEEKVRKALKIITSNKNTSKTENTPSNSNTSIPESKNQEIGQRNTRKNGISYYFHKILSFFSKAYSTILEWLNGFFKKEDIHIKKSKIVQNFKSNLDSLIKGTLDYPSVEKRETLK